MQRRHYGHRSEVKTAADGLGEHFYNHAVQMGLNLNTQTDEIMEHCTIPIIASFESNQLWSEERVHTLEADLQETYL